MNRLARVRRMLATGAPRRNRVGWAIGPITATVGLALVATWAMAAPPEDRSPSKPDAAAKKTIPPSARYNPSAATAGKYYAIESKFLLDDGSTLMAPKVSAREGENAYVKNGSESPFVTRLTRTADGGSQPNIEILDEGIQLKLKAVGDTDGLVNLDATVEVIGISSVGTKTAARTTRQALRQRSQTVRAIESLAPGEKLSIALDNPRPKPPPMTTLEALANAVRGKRPPVPTPRTMAVEITVREAKTLPQDAVRSSQLPRSPR